MNRAPVKRSRPQARLRSTLIAGAIVIFAGTLRVLTGPTVFGDEGWFVQVCSRVLAGQRLYADVFFPATPVSLWVAAAGMRLLGTEVLVLKVLDVVLFAGTALCIVAVGRARRLKSGTLALLVVALFAFSPPGASGPFYNALASFLLAACLVAAFLWIESWQDSPKASGLTVGVLLGLTLMTKQNVGALALAAFLVVAAHARLRLRGSSTLSRSVRWAAIGCGATVLLGLVPVVATGSLPAFVRWTVATRSVYVQTAAVPYASGLQRLQRLGVAERSLASMAGILQLAVYLLPLFGIALSGTAFVRRRDTRSLALLAFAVAGLASAYPRWDARHLMLGAPLFLAAAACAWPEVSPLVPRRLVRPAGTVATALVVATAVLALTVNLQRLASGWYEPLGLPHFAGALAQRELVTDTTAAVATLKASADGRPIFVLAPRAGALYLGSGLRNPTADDYPSGHTTTEIQRAVVAGIEDGSIGGLWYDRWQEEDPEKLMPVLTTYVRDRMAPEIRTVQGTLYRKRR